MRSINLRSTALPSLSRHPLSFAVVVGLMTLVAAPAGLAQNADDEDSVLEEVVVQGFRNTIQSSIEVKRESNMVVEALSSDDIGDIPALSIGEALETLTSVVSHREQGGATEVSIRGMGPYLSSTNINGREATNGSGDRSVNFSMFPSELFNELKVYKTQSAELIEGGVSGLIEMETLKPLDYDRQRTQVELKGSYKPENADIHGANHEYGYRATGSYVGQWDLGGDSRLGLSIGAQTNQDSNPEAESRSSSAWRACRNDPNASSGVYALGNCDSSGGMLDLVVDPDTGVAPDVNTPFVFVPSQRAFRQNVTDDSRESVFAAMQFQPNERWDINWDAQWSSRTFSEVRNDLVFAEQRIVHPDGLVVGDNGIISEFANFGRIETLSSWAERGEEYKGTGLDVEFQATDRLLLSFDASYSNTARQEYIVHTRLQSEDNDIYGNDVPAGTDRPNAWYVVNGGPADITTVTVENFDVTNHDLFADSARTRIDLNQDTENTISAFRTDFDLEMGGGFITDIEGGLRYSELELVASPRNRDERTFADDAIQGASLACRTDFPEPGFMSNPLNGQNMVTNVDENGNVIASGTGNTFATFDPLCLVNEFTGGDWSWPVAGPSVQSIDVEESTIAGYLQANYMGEFAGLPVRGNFGVRVVNTDVTSIGNRTTFTTVQNPDGTIRVEEDPENLYQVAGGSSYTEFLPSVNLVVDLDENLLLRGGIYRGMSRPDPSDMGYGRSFNVDDDDATSLDDLVASATATGNPDLEPLMSWNFDAAIEWYPNEDTLLAFGTYYKSFQGGFRNIQREETFLVDGQPVIADVTTFATDETTNTLYGFEVTASHAFTYLPGIFSGLGGKLSYNWADSDFEFEDGNWGDAEVVDEDGNVVSRRVGILPPANLFGFSKNVFSGQVYWGIGPVDMQFIYKSRSEYFQQFISSPGIIRYVDDNSTVEARLTWRINSHLSMKLEGINLLDEPKVQRIPTISSLSELNDYSPMYFLSLRARF